MASNNLIVPGDLITIKDAEYSFLENNSESEQNTTPIKKDTIGIVLNITDSQVKIIWNIDRQAVIVFMSIDDIILLDLEP